MDDCRDSVAIQVSDKARTGYQTSSISHSSWCYIDFDNYFGETVPAVRIAYSHRVRI